MTPAKNNGSTGSIVVKRTIPATVDELFDAWLDPESLAQWMHPGTTARSRMRMCLEVELSEIGNAPASSVTRASDSAKRARIARRVPSDTAANSSSSCVFLYSSIWVNIGLGKFGVKCFYRDVCSPASSGCAIWRTLDRPAVAEDRAFAVRWVPID